MPRIRCAYEDCVFLSERYCTASEVEIDPDHGCQTYKPTAEVLADWGRDAGLDDDDDFLDDDDDFLDDDDLWDDDL